MEQSIVTTINGVGFVEAKNDRANFTLTIKFKDDSLEVAKNKIQEKSLKVLKDLKDKNLPLDGEISSSISNYKLENRENGERYLAGYQSVNTISFTVIVNSDIDDINKMCLNIDPNMTVPQFFLKNKELLLDEALKKASVDIIVKTSKQCNLLGVSSDNLKIKTWNFMHGPLDGRLPNYAVYGPVGAIGPTGPMGSAGLNGFLNSSNVQHSGYQAPVMKLGSIYQELLDSKLEVGVTSVTVTAQVTYVWAS